MWQNYVNALLGLCLIIISIAVASSIDTTLVWTFGGIGALTLILGLWGGSSESYEQEHRRA